MLDYLDDPKEKLVYGTDHGENKLDLVGRADPRDYCRRLSTGYKISTARILIRAWHTNGLRVGKGQV